MLLPCKYGPGTQGPGTIWARAPGAKDQAWATRAKTTLGPAWPVACPPHTTLVPPQAKTKPARPRTRLLAQPLDFVHVICSRSRTRRGGRGTWPVKTHKNDGQTLKPRKKTHTNNEINRRTNGNYTTLTLIANRREPYEFEASCFCFSNGLVKTIKK